MHRTRSTLALSLLFWLVFSMNTAAARFSKPPTVSAKPNTTYTFSSTKDGVAHSGTWRDDKQSILQADGSGRVAFPLFVFNGPRFGNMDYKGEFFIESGNEDRYAGFVFRLVDAGNYYAVRFSASENNIFFARFDNGTRTILKSFDATVRSRHWERIRLVAHSDAITIFLNGRKIGQASDAKWRVGKAGLGTKADSVTRFRKIRIRTPAS
jgi:hypothetical protein